MEATTDVIEQPGSENEWLVELHVNGSPVEFKIDTGADITVMSQTAFNRLVVPTIGHDWAKTTRYQPRR